MVTKIYFPRLILPMSSVFAGLVDFAIAFVILVGLMFYYQVTPAWNLLWTLPLFLLLAIVTALGVALWLSAINVQYRDVNQALPFLTQFWLFATPVAYSASVISEKWQVVYSLNPMAGVVNGFRWALLGTGKDPTLALGFRRHFNFDFRLRAFLFQKHGKDLCGYDIIPVIARRVFSPTKQSPPLSRGLLRAKNKSALAMT